MNLQVNSCQKLRNCVKICQNYAEWRQRQICTRTHEEQESWAIAKMTARCTLYMGALKIFMGIFSDGLSECTVQIWNE